MKPDIKIFAGSASIDLTKRIAKSLIMEPGKVVLRKFSDGEFSPYFDESVRGVDVFIVQSTHQPTDNLFELLQMIDAAKRASAKKIIVVNPYYGFARQDRKDRPRVAITAKIIANMLKKAGAKRVITMDLHAPQIQGFFDIPVDHLMASAVFAPYIEQLKIENLTFAAPDTGSADRVRKYAAHFKTNLVICDKSRKGPNEVGPVTVIGDVKDKNIVILDDMVDTAGTLEKVAQAIMDKEAKSVRAFCTHPVLSGDAYENIENSPLLELVTTDTIPLKKESSKIKVLSVADLFATAIKRVYSNQSVNDLFIF